MGYQTLEALKTRKLNSWLNKEIITKDQYKSIIYYCIEYGFWEALGYATRLKYRNNPSLKSKYIYKWITIPKKKCLLMENKTSGAWSIKKRKRIRKWRNIFYTVDGKRRNELIKEKYPDWEIFHMKHGCYRIGLRKTCKASSPDQE